MHAYWPLCCWSSSIDFSLITFNWFHTIYVDNLPIEVSWYLCWAQSEQKGFCLSVTYEVTGWLNFKVHKINIPIFYDHSEFFFPNDCFFAQFFSPSGVNPVPVDLVFVIDLSGSMSGRKIRQTIEALETIINQLRLEDKFTMVTFESRVQTWKRRLVSVQHYRSQAINFAKGLRASGGTNFNGGLQTGARILKEYSDPNNVHLLVLFED